MAQPLMRVEEDSLLYKVAVSVPILGAIVSHSLHKSLTTKVMTIWGDRENYQNNLMRYNNTYRQNITLIQVKNSIKRSDIARALIGSALIVAIATAAVVYLHIPVILSAIVATFFIAISLAYVGWVAIGISRNNGLIALLNDSRNNINQIAVY